MAKDLEELGLTKNEAIIYEFLLKTGSTTTGKIIKTTGIANSRVYESLNSLIAKGLVVYEVQKDGKHFQAAPPHILLDNLDEKRKLAEKLVPQLEDLKKLISLETTTAVYEGFSGFKTAFSKIINDCPVKGSIDIIGFSGEIYSSENLLTFVKNMNLKSANKKQKLRIVLPQTAKSTYGKDRSKEKYSEVKYLPEGYISPAALDIFDDYVYIFLWDKEPFVFMIKNKKVAESFRNYFAFLWKLAK